MADHERFEIESPREFPESPTQETVHIVAFSSVNDNRFVFGRLNMASITLANINEVDLENPVLLKILLSDPPTAASRSNVDPTPINLLNPCPVTPKELVNWRLSFCRSRLALCLVLNGGWITDKDFITNSHGIFLLC
jgi:hypothetical protein